MSGPSPAGPAIDVPSSAEETHLRTVEALTSSMGHTPPSFAIWEGNTMRGAIPFSHGLCAVFPVAKECEVHITRGMRPLNPKLPGFAEIAASESLCACESCGGLYVEPNESFEPFYGCPSHNTAECTVRNPFPFMRPYVKGDITVPFCGNVNLKFLDGPLKGNVSFAMYCPDCNAFRCVVKCDDDWKPIASYDSWKNTDLVLALIEINKLYRRADYSLTSAQA